MIREGKMKMYIYSAVLIVVLGIAITDYVLKPKIIHSLECVLSQVVNVPPGTVTNIERQNAIDNNYTYYMNVYNNGILMVNDVDQYLQDTNNTNSYMLNFNGKTQPNLKFEFTKSYDDVTFHVKKIDVKYEYECESKN